MSLKRLPRSLLLPAVAVVAVVVVLMVWIWGAGESSTSAAQGPPIDARADVTPRRVLFGDMVTATVEVTLDRDRVDPDSVQVGADFKPWKPIAEPERLRQDGDGRTTIRMTYVLRCLTSACIATDAEAVQTENLVQTFGQARVIYRAPEGTGSRSPVTRRVAWPRFLVDARFSQRDAQNAGTSSGGWRADLLTMPAVTYSMSPGFVLALLVVLGTLLGVATFVLVRAARLRRAPAAARAVEPTGPVLTPLERALALLEDRARVDGAADQRRALELVAAALAQRGDATLAHASRALAWSEPVPGVPETNGMAVRARAALGVA